MFPLVAAAASASLYDAARMRTAHAESINDASEFTKAAALRRRLTPLGRTSLLTEEPTNRSVPMFMLRIRYSPGI